MSHYKYLIVGAGMAADAAVKGIRELDKEGTIGVVGAEEYPPYARPPLSKKLWQGKPFDIIWRKTAELQVTLHLGKSVNIINPVAKTVATETGELYSYDKLLLAIGGTPRRLPFGGEDIIYFRTINDYQRLRERALPGSRFAVIGGGFIGSEIAAALAMNGCQVVLLFPEQSIGSRAYPAELAHFLNDYYSSKGVEVLPGTTVNNVQKAGEQVLVRTEGGGEYLVDGVVAGLGIEPNQQLPARAGIKVGNGVPVNELLQTDVADIFAAGDLAEFFSPLLGKRIRVEHEDNAVAMGRQAGLNMAGANEPYNYQPFFYTDMFDIGYEAIGELDSRLETVVDWHEPFRQGVVYYLRQGRVCGVLLWNVWDKLEKARQLMAEPGPFRSEELKGYIV